MRRVYARGDALEPPTMMLAGHAGAAGSSPAGGAGFGAGATDYNFGVEDTATGAGVRVLGDQPITRLNVFSIDKVQSVEPYNAIDLRPSEEKRWRYSYNFVVP